LAPRTPVKRGGKRNRQEEVLEVAVEIFHEKGYASTSIQDVADRVGVLKGSLYHYIDSKEDLLARIFEESDKQSFALMEEIRALDLPAKERLRQFARSWSLWYLENIERASVYVKEWSHLTGDRKKNVVATRRDYDRRVAEIIEDVEREGSAAPGLDTRLACFFVLSAINGLPTWYRRRDPDSATRIADVYADMILNSVCGTDGGKASKATAAKKKRQTKPRSKK
jgi:AcrR family transcriptional regulator